MLELNKVHKVDVMEGMQQLDDNCDWIGFDLFDEYIQMTNNRIKN